MRVGYAMGRIRWVEMVQEERRNGLNILGYVVIGGDQVAPFVEGKCASMGGVLERRFRMAVVASSAMLL